MTTLQVRNAAIARMADAGRRHRDLAAEYGVSPGRVWQIVQREHSRREQRELYATFHKKSREAELTYLFQRLVASPEFLVWADASARYGYVA